MPPLEAPRKTGVPFDYEGIPIHARGLTLAAVYDSHWQPTAGSAWVEYGYVPDCWRHPAFPGHILWTPEDGVVLIAHLSSSTPRIATVEALGQLALGPTATPISVATYPLALRLPMRGPGQLDVPAGGFRCRRLWPLKGEPAHVETVERVPIELRISGTRGNTGVRIYAEAFVGRAHVTAAQDEKDGRKRKKEKPRSLIFSGDARHVLLQRDPRWVKAFTARLIDRLLIFAHERGDLGLEIDHRTMPGRRVGRVQVRAGFDDLEFDIRLPQPHGTLRFVGDYAVPPTR